MTPSPSRSIQLDRRELTWEFASSEAMRSVFESHGGAVMAKGMLRPDVYESMSRELEALVSGLNEGTQGRIVIGRIPAGGGAQGLILRRRILGDADTG